MKEKFLAIKKQVVIYSVLSQQVKRKIVKLGIDNYWIFDDINLSEDYVKLSDIALVDECNLGEFALELSEIENKEANVFVPNYLLEEFKIVIRNLNLEVCCLDKLLDYVFYSYIQTWDEDATECLDSCNNSIKKFAKEIYSNQRVLKKIKKERRNNFE